jgi:hypothetical protein
MNTQLGSRIPYGAGVSSVSGTRRGLCLLRAYQAALVGRTDPAANSTLLAESLLFITSRPRVREMCSQWIAYFLTSTALCVAILPKLFDP